MASLILAIAALLLAGLAALFAWCALVNARAFERRWGPGHQAAFSVKGLAVMAGVLFVVWVALLVSALSAGGAAH